MRTRRSQALDARLSALLDHALVALSTDRRDLGAEVRTEEGDAVVSVGARRFVIGRQGRSRILGWERLADALPAMVERARLGAMHRLADADWPALWSVYTTETTLAWLAQAQPNPSSLLQWEQAIVREAQDDGSVAFRCRIGSRTSTLKGILRSRELRARIGLGDGAEYDSHLGTIVARDVVPDTVAISTGGRHVAKVVDLPWTLHADITIASASVGDAGTTLLLREQLRPLEPIPDAARTAVPPDAPEHAPWIVTPREREALDAIDAEAHRTL